MDAIYEAGIPASQERVGLRAHVCRCVLVTHKIEKKTYFFVILAYAKKSRAEAAIHHSPHRKYQKPTGCEQPTDPKKCEPADEIHKRRPPERNSIYAGYQYFRICQPQATLPKNQNRRAKALFPNHKPTPRPHLMKALTSSRAGRRRNPTSSLHTIRRVQSPFPNGTGKRARARN